MDQSKHGGRVIFVSLTGCFIEVFSGGEEDTVKETEKKRNGFRLMRFRRRRRWRRRRRRRRNTTFYKTFCVARDLQVFRLCLSLCRSGAPEMVAKDIWDRGDCRSEVTAAHLLTASITVVQIPRNIPAVFSLPDLPVAIAIAQFLSALCFCLVFIVILFYFIFFFLRFFTLNSLVIGDRSLFPLPLQLLSLCLLFAFV